MSFGDPLRGLTPGSELKGVLELVAATVGLLAYVFVAGPQAPLQQAENTGTCRAGQFRAASSG